MRKVGVQLNLRIFKKQEDKRVKCQAKDKQKHQPSSYQILKQQVTRDGKAANLFE